MEIKIYVVGQTLKVATIPYEFIDGSQNFVAFKFHLDSAWDELRPFAQFIQDEVAYNVYLDENGVCYLPPEIVEGTFLLLLYGAAGDVRATTNFLEFTVKHNILIGDAQSIEITQSLYDQLVNKVNKVLDDITNSGIDDLVKVQVGQIVADYVNQGRIANLVIGNGSIEKAKLASSVQASLNKADNSWQKSTSTGSASPTSGSWEATYDTHKNATDIFDYAANQSKTAIGRLRNIATGNVSDGMQTFTVEGHTYTGIDAALTGVYNLSADLIGDSSPVSIEVVNSRPATGNDLTFYLIPKGNGKYEKWWYIDNGTGTKVWDSFGSSSTEVVNSLPNNPSPDVDYILNTNGEYTYYKYINDGWRMIAGSGSVVLTNNNDGSIKVFGKGSPSNTILADLSAGDKYLNTNNFYLFNVTGSGNSKSWGSGSAVIASPSTNKDYYIKDPSGNWAHFRYINNTFERIGMDAYSRSEVDDMIDDVSGDVSQLSGQVSQISTAVNNMTNMVKDVTINTDKTQLTVTYADNATSQITLDTGTDIDHAVYNENGDYALRFYDSNDNELEDLTVIIEGGGGGTTIGGTAVINYVTPANVQVVFGNTCIIEYTVTARNSAGDFLTKNGTGTLYVNDIAVESGFTVSPTTTNRADVTPYLTVGSNSIRIVVSIDTEGENNTVARKSWEVSAINMYFDWNYLDSQINTSAISDYYTPYGALSKTIYTFIDVDPINFNPVIVSALPNPSSPDFDAEEAANTNYFVGSGNSYQHYIYRNGSFIEAPGRLFNVYVTARSGSPQSLNIPMQTHGSHAVVRYVEGQINGNTIKTQQQVHDMIFVVQGNTTPIIGVSYNTATVTQYNTVQIPIVVYDPARTTTTVELYEDGNLVSTWNDVDRTIHYWNYSPTAYGNKTLTITCGETSKTISFYVEQLDIDEAEVDTYDFRFKASEFATNDAVKAWSNTYTPPGSIVEDTIDIDFSDNFDWVNGGLHTEEDENGHLRQYFCVRAGTSMTINYDLFGSAYDPKRNGKNFKFIFKAVNCRVYDSLVLSCKDTEVGNNGVGLVMTANEGILTTVNEQLVTHYYKDTYIEFEMNIHPTTHYSYLQFWMDGSHDMNLVYKNDDSMQQVNPVGITIGSNDCDVYVYMVKAYPTYMTNDNEISNFIMDAPNAYEMVERYNRNDIMDETGDNIDYNRLAANNPNLRVLLLDINRMTTGKKDYVVAHTFRQIYNGGGASHCFTINNCCVSVQGTSSVGYIESAANVDINFKYNRTFTSNNESFTTGEIRFDDNTTSTKGYAMTENSIPVDYINVKVNVASSENANNACIADWYNTYQPWRSPARKKNSKARDTMEFTPGVIFIKDRSGGLFGDTTNYHFYGICDIGNSKKNTKVFHDTSNPIACCVEVSNNTSLPCLMATNDYTWNADDEATVLEWSEEDQEYKEQLVFEFRYVGDDHVKECEDAWDRFVNFMYTYNPTQATNNPLPEPVTFGNYTFKGTGTFDTTAYDSDDYDVCYLYGYGASTYAAADYVSDTSGEGTCYYYINYTNNHIYSSNGSSWTDEGALTWTADLNNVLAGTTIGTYAGRYTTDSFNYRMAQILAHCEEYMIMDPVVYHFVFIESFLMTDNVAKNTFWSSDDLVHWEPSKDYDNDRYMSL